jgi:hypothetical protein
MDLSAAEFGYFVSQVAMSAASFGVAKDDLTVVGTALNSLFGMKDSAPAVVVPSQPAALQAICVAEGCPTAANATTSGYSSVAEPSTAVSSLVPSLSSATGTATAAMTGSASGKPTGSASGSGSGSGTASPSASATGNSAATLGMNFAAAAGGFAVAGGFAAMLL